MASTSKGRGLWGTLPSTAIGLERMQRDNLPVVKEIDPEPADLVALLLYLRDTFQLANATEIPAPPWALLLI